MFVSVFLLKSQLKETNFYHNNFSKCWNIFIQYYSFNFVKVQIQINKICIFVSRNIYKQLWLSDLASSGLLPSVCGPSSFSQLPHQHVDHRPPGSIHSDLEMRGRDACCTLPEFSLFLTSFCIIFLLPSSFVLLWYLLFSFSCFLRAQVRLPRPAKNNAASYFSVFPFNHRIAGSLNVCLKVSFKKQ